MSSLPRHIWDDPDRSGARRILAFAFCNAAANSWGTESAANVVVRADHLSYIAAMLTLLTVAVAAWKGADLTARWKPACAVGASLACTGSLLPLLSGSLPEQLLIAFAAAFSGIGTGILLVLVILVLRQLEVRQLAIEIACGCLIMTLLLTGSSLLTVTWSLSARALFSLLAAYFVYRELGAGLLHTEPQRSAIVGPSLRPAILFLLAVNLIGLPLSTVHNLYRIHGVAGMKTATLQVPSLLVDVGFLIGIITVMTLYRSLGTHHIYRFTAGVGILGLLLLPIVGTHSIYPFLANAAGYMSLAAFVWIVAIRIARSLRVSAVSICGLALLSFFADRTVPIASDLSTFMATSLNPTLTLNMLSFGGVALTFVAYAAVFTEKTLIAITTVEDAHSESPGPLNSPTARAAFARRHTLTEREMDVLILLAKGRSGTRVQQELFISQGTFNFHSANIYHKLSVHSRQELMDLVESEDFGIANEPPYDHTVLSDV